MDNGYWTTGLIWASARQSDWDEDCHLQSNHEDGKDLARVIDGMNIQVRLDPGGKGWLKDGGLVKKTQDQVDGVKDQGWIAKNGKNPSMTAVLDFEPSL